MHLEKIVRIPRTTVDAFLITDKKNEELILKIIIKQLENKIIVKLSDNGSGFQYMKKSQYFFRPQIKNLKKDHSKNIGGAFIGLKTLEDELTEIQAKLYFKNRKNLGASSYMEFSLDHVPSQKTFRN